MLERRLNKPFISNRYSRTHAWLFLQGRQRQIFRVPEALSAGCGTFCIIMHLKASEQTRVENLQKVQVR